MKRMHPFATLALALACLAAAAPAARAESLSDLLTPGATITSDGLAFSNFTHTPTGA